MNTFTLRRSWLFHAGARVASALTIASLVVTLAGPALFAFPHTALAATSIFTESFGTGNSADDVPGWRESEHPNDNDDDVIARKGENSGTDKKSPNDGRFLKIKGDGSNDGEWACKKITTTGYQTLVLTYFWRGEGEAENNDYGIVEVRANGTDESSCNSNENGGWTQITAHPLDNSASSNSTSQEEWALNTSNLPSDDDGMFLLRFRNDSSSSGEYFRVDGIQIEGDPIPGTLIVKKVLSKDNGGIADADDFSFSVNGATAVPFESDGQNEISVAPGAYSVVETTAPGYTTTYDNCSDVQVASGQTATCTITNDDKPAKLTVVKELTNTGGGTASKDDFKFQINDGEWTWFNENGIHVIELNAGVYTVEEDTTVNYATDYSNCTQVELGIGEEATCTVYNTYVPPPPPQCNQNALRTLVSDATTLSEGTPTVPLTFIHAAWTASISGATWIWSEEPLTDASGETTEVFVKTFTISNPVVGDGTLMIAADNSYAVDVNGNTDVCVDTSENNHAAADTCVVPGAYLVAGANTLTFHVKNWAQEGGTQQSNPAGLLFKFTYNVNECEDFLSCDPEVNLVQNAGFEAPVVTANGGTWELYANGTPLLEWMSSYLSGNTPSLIEIQRGYSGWLAAEGSQFAELDSNEPTTIYQDIPTIPGKNYTFSYKFAARPDASSLADNTARAWWGGSLAGTPSSDTVSAGPNTDWKMFTHSVVATTSLTRIAIEDAGTPNSLGNFVDQVSVICQPEPPKASVTICKSDTNENSLSGWTMLLKGDHVEDVSVPTNTSAGVNTVASLTGGASYIAVASGTWNNQGGANPVDAEYSTTDGWATQIDGYTGYQTDILELQINSAFDPNSNWGPYTSTHEYAQSFVQGVTGTGNFRIFDGTGTTQNEEWFGDNSGTLAVSVYEGYAGVTGENGCVTFTDVPYGTYTVGELMKANWQNESGLASVTVDEKTETFEVVNKDLTPPPTATVVADKVVCDAEQYLPNWGDGAADITATTAADWVAQSDGKCRLAKWTFEWAPAVATNPGDNVLSGGAGWTSFTGSVSVPAGSLIWLREEMFAGYVPFTGANTTEDVSAEFYCHSDVFNYDNYDWIDPVVSGQTYYCVGFNAPTAPTEPPFCGDGVANQDWEQCDLGVEGGENCTAQCQFTSQQCTENVFARVHVTDVQNWGDGDASNKVYLGSNSSYIPAGTWFPVKYNNVVITDPSVSGYEDVPGLAVQRSPSGVLVLLHGDHTEEGDEVEGTDKEHVTGSVEFWNSAATSFTNATGQNKPENPSNGTKNLNPGNDETWLATGVSYFWFTVTGADDAYTTAYSVPQCEYDEENGGTLIIVKNTVGGDGSFTIGVEEVGNYVLETENGTDSVTIDELDGTYDVIELVPEGWTLSSVVCEYDGESEGESIENGKTVYIDEGDVVTCTFTNTKDENEEEEEGGGGGGGSPIVPPILGGGVTGLGGGGGSVLGASTGGQVLGASCGLYMDKFIRLGKKNDVEQVKKLQIFLNKNLGLSIPVTGFYGPITYAAVLQFQTKYAAEILAPWGIAAPTGIVYQTTLRQINMLECPELALELPPLVEWSN